VKFGHAMIAVTLPFSADPAIACSGMGLRGQVITADVIVIGHAEDVTASKSDEIVASTVLKGDKASRYKVIWRGTSLDDECGFLSAAFREHGVYFLKRHPDGGHVVVWTEARWKRRWGTYIK